MAIKRKSVPKLDLIKQKMASNKKLKEPTALPKGPVSSAGQAIFNKNKSVVKSASQDAGIKRNPKVAEPLKAQQAGPRISGQSGQGIISPVVETPLTPEEAAAKLESDTKSLLNQEEFQKFLDLNETLGLDIGDAPSNLEEFLQQQKDRQLQDKEFVLEQQRLQKQQEQKEFKQLTRSGESQAAGVEASLAPGREGFVAGTAAGAIGQFEQVVNERISIAAGKLTMAENARERDLVALERAQQDGNLDMVKTISARLAGYESQIRQEQANLQQVRNEQVQLALQVNADVRANVDSFQTLALTGVDLDKNALISFSKSLGLPFEQVSGIYDGLQAIRDDKSLTTQQKQIETQSMLESLNDQIRGVETEKAKNIDLYTGLVRSGYFTSDDERFTFARALGIEEFDDPFVQLDFQIKQLEAERDAATNPLDIQIKELQIKKAKQELNESMGLGGGAGSVIKSDLDVNDVPSGAGSNNILDYNAFYHGSSSNADGPDFAAPTGTAVKAHFAGEVIGITTGKVPTAGAGGWGNQIRVIDADDNVHQYSHLSGVDVEVGDILSFGQEIGQVGNTGRVLGGNGEELSQAQIDADRGAHLDYTVYKPDGSKYSLGEAYKFATGTPGAAASDFGFDAGALAIQLETAASSVSDKKDVKENIKFFTDSGNKEGLKTYIEKTIFSDLGAKRKEQLEQRALIVGRMDYVSGLMQEYEDAGGDLGIFTGTKTRVLNKINQLDSDAQKIAQIILINLEDYGRAQTGAAIQDFESDKFEDILPNVFDGKELSNAKFEAFAEVLELDVETTLKKGLGKGLYNDLYGGVQEDQEQNFDDLSIEQLQDIAAQADAMPTNDVKSGFDALWDQFTN